MSVAISREDHHINPMQVPERAKRNAESLSMPIGHKIAITGMVVISTAGVALIIIHYLTSLPLLLPGAMTASGGGIGIIIFLLVLHGDKTNELQLRKEILDLSHRMNEKNSELQTQQEKYVVTTEQLRKLQAKENKLSDKYEKLHSEYLSFLTKMSERVPSSQIDEVLLPKESYASKNGMPIKQFLILPAESDLNVIFLNPEDLKSLFPFTSVSTTTKKIVWIANSMYVVSTNEQVKPGQLGVNSYQYAAIMQDSQSTNKQPSTVFIKPVPPNIPMKNTSLVVTIKYTKDNATFDSRITQAQLKQNFMLALGDIKQVNIGRRVFVFSQGLIEFKISEIHCSNQNFAPEQNAICEVTGDTKIVFEVSRQSSSKIIIEDQVDAKNNPPKNNPPEKKDVPKRKIKTKQESKPFNLMEALEKEGIVGLPDNFKTVINTISFSQGKLKKEYEKRGLEKEKGIILYGPPGTGKTSIARVIGNALGCDDEHIIMKGCTELMGGIVGDTEKSIRKLFEDAKKSAEKAQIEGEESPLFVIVLDEIDSILLDRKYHRNTWETTALNEFLNQMDGLVKGGNFLVIGMTNRFEFLDPAIKRPGRFGTCVEIGLPNSQQIRQILTKHLAPLKNAERLAEDVVIDHFVNLLNDFSGAEIKGIIGHANNASLGRLQEILQIDPDRDISNEPMGKVSHQDILDGITYMRKKKN